MSPERAAHETEMGLRLDMFELLYELLCDSQNVLFVARQRVQLPFR